VEIEYKLDPRDHQYKLLDFNARTWGYNSIGARAGVDLNYMLYADQVGQAITRCRGESGVAWMRLVTDLPAAVMASLAGDVSLKSYLQSLMACNVEAVFSHDDPLPGVVELLLVPYLAVKRGF
jgi:predicted ATP-grasp superfamily ATP-dependent carboligase